MASFTDLYPERRGGLISPTTLQVNHCKRRKNPLFSVTDRTWGLTLTPRNLKLPLIDYFTETDRIRGFTPASQDLLRAAPGLQCRRQEILLDHLFYNLPTNLLNLLFLTSSCQGCPWWRPCLRLSRPLGALWTLSVIWSVFITTNSCVWNVGGTNSSAYLTKTSTRFVRCANLDQRYNMLEAMIQPLIRFANPIHHCRPNRLLSANSTSSIVQQCTSSGIRLLQ